MKGKTIIIAYCMLYALVIAGCGSGTGPASDPSVFNSLPTASNCVNAACHGSAFDAASSPDAIFSAISSASSRKIAAMHIAEVNIGSNFNNSVFKSMTASTKRLPQYVYTGSQCADCHSHQSADNKTIRGEWAESVHGEHAAVAWNKINGKLSGFLDGTSTYLSGYNSGTIASRGSQVGNVCVRCHTKTGYVSFVTSDFLTINRLTDGTDKTKEVLSCDGCHTNVTTGIIRIVKPFRGFWGYSTVAANGRDRRLPPVNVTYTFTDIGASNVCVPCHVGRNIQNSSAYLIKKLNTYDAYSTVRTRAGGDGTVVGTNGHGYKNYVGPDLGYEYTGANYTENAYSHSKVGIANLAGSGTKGACVGCHMKLGKGHTFEATANYTDYISACAGCHNGTITATVDKSKIDNLIIWRTDAVKVLQALIANRYVGNYPTVVSKAASNAAVPYLISFNFAKVIRWYKDPSEFAVRGDFQGANYNASYVANTNMYHNPLYSRRLLFDSADFIVNGRLTGDASTISAAIDSIPVTPATTDSTNNNFLPTVSGRDAATQKANAKTYFYSSRP